MVIKYLFLDFFENVELVIASMQWKLVIKKSLTMNFIVRDFFITSFHCIEAIADHANVQNLISAHSE